MLLMHLQELAPNHTIIDESAFLDEVMDELESLGSQCSQRTHKLYKETQNKCMCFCLGINEMEQSSLQPLHAPGVPPPNSGCIHPSPTAEHMSQKDGGNGVVQGL